MEADLPPEFQYHVGNLARRLAHDGTAPLVQSQ